MRSLVVASALLALTGCGAITTNQYRGLSAGPVGCPEEEIEVREEKNVVWAGDTMTWRASCRGKEFICSMAGQTATCKEELRAASPSATPAAPAAGQRRGCDYDTQCKGDRICVDRACVDPTPEAPAAPAPPETRTTPEG